MTSQVAQNNRVYANVIHNGLYRETIGFSSSACTGDQITLDSQEFDLPDCDDLYLQDIDRKKYLKIGLSGCGRKVIFQNSTMEI